MANQNSMGLFQAVLDALESVHQPVPVEEVIENILKRRPSQSKNPVARTRSYLLTEHAGKTLVFVDRKTVVPVRVAMRGVRFRVYLSQAEVDAGALLIYPTFHGYRARDLELEDIQLYDADGAPLPSRAKVMELVEADEFGTSVHEASVFPLGDWFRTCGVEPNDSLVITIDDWDRGDFRLAHEPADQRRETEIEHRNQILSDLLFDILEAERGQDIAVRPSLLTAYVRFPDPQGYPPDHWRYAIEDDERMACDGYTISYKDAPSLFEDFFYPQRRNPRNPPAVRSHSRQDRQIYRFKAVLKHRPRLWRRVEIQGGQMLANFDLLLRQTFQHDTGDHLGGFWKQIRRGTSNRYREIGLGTVDPLGDGDGAEQSIAELELKRGDEVKYVYDFGDWIEHVLTLEAIVEPEASATYPRVVDRNKSRNQYCQACKAAKRQTVAIWLCHDCSYGRLKMRLCEACMMDEHEEHFGSDIVY